MNVYGWYDAVSMFVNDIEWWSRHSIFRRGDIVLRLLGCVLFGGFELRRYPDFIGTLDSHKWRLPGDRWWESKEVHIVMSEVWNMNLSK